MVAVASGAWRGHLAGSKGQGLGFLALGLALGGALIASGKSVYAVQDGVSTLASAVPLGYAFGAGMVAAANPCGVLMLPSLVAHYLTRGETVDLSSSRRASQALLFAAMATLGFVTVFAVVGLLVGAGGRALASAFPVAGLLVGVALAGMGAWLAISGRGFGVAAAGRAMERVRLSSGVRSLFLFGVAYAVTSLACTLPIFLVVAGSALATGGLVAAAGQFVSYAFGMGTALTAVILGAALFQGAVRRPVRWLVPYVHRLAASFLVGAGLFVAHYWLVAMGLLR